MTVLRTNGWDLVAAIRQGSCNQQLLALYNAGKLPHQISVDLNLPLVGPATVTAKFAAPSLKPCQTGVNLVKVFMPLTGGSIKTKFGTIDIPLGVTVVVTTDLQYIHLEFKDEGKVLRLYIDFTLPDAVYDIEIDPSVKDWDPDYNTVLTSAVRKQMEEDAADPGYDYSYHVADIVLPDGVPEGLEPTGEADFTIQIVDPTGPGDDNIVGLVMVTAGGKIGLSNVFQGLPPLVPGGHVSSVIVSNETLIKKLIVPQLAEGLKISPSDFTFSGGGTTPLVASLATHPYLGGTFEIYIWNVTVKVGEDGSLAATYEAHAHPLVDTKEAFYIKITGSLSLVPQIQVNKKGQQEIVFVGTASDPVCSVEAEWYVYVIVVAAIILSFGTLSLAFATIAAAVVAILMATLSFPVDVPSDIKDMLAQGITAVVWPLQKEYPLDGVMVPGDFIITGVPNLG